MIARNALERGMTEDEAREYVIAALRGLDTYHLRRQEAEVTRKLRERLS